LACGVCSSPLTVNLTVHDSSGASTKPMRRAAALAEAVMASVVVVGHNVCRIVPNEVLVLLPLGLISLLIRRQSLQAIGFRRVVSWRRTVLIATCFAVFLQVLSVYVTEPLISHSTGQPSDLSQFRDAVGNVGVTSVWLAIAWTFAAFGEEFVYRGYVLNRIADALGSGSRALGIAMVATSVLFGIGHSYQGATGMIDTTISGLVFGGLYVWSGRNLWLPILTHGLADTIAIVLIFLGLITV
jgi:membrane protease YdiL (CAAX protease family)